MNIKTAFLSSLIAHPMCPSRQSPESFLGHIIPGEAAPASPLFYLLSCGKIRAVPPWSFDSKGMDCCLLLYTKSGCGKLLVNNQVYTLSESTLLFWDCSQRFRLDITLSPWEYQILFFGGTSLPFYCRLLPGGEIPLVTVPAGSDIAMDMERLVSCTAVDTTSRKLMVSDLLGHIVTCCVTGVMKEEERAPRMPLYIEHIKELFDNSYQEAYTLNGLAERFGINKYRLCREFRSACQETPLQYLNRQRIAHAAGLLLTTGWKVHEIGAMVGIENTNHFISLFKKYYGLTPLEYKERMAF